MLSARFQGLAKREPRALCAGLILQLMTCGSVLAQEPASPAPKLAPGPAPPQTVKLGFARCLAQLALASGGLGLVRGRHRSTATTPSGIRSLRVGLGQKREPGGVAGRGQSGHGSRVCPPSAVAPAPLGQLGRGATYYAANGNSRNNANAFVKQAFVQLNELGPISLKVGRFEFFDGAEAVSTDPTVATLVQTRIAHRLISNFGFTAAQRTFDGARFAWNGGSNNVTPYSPRVPRAASSRSMGWARSTCKSTTARSTGLITAHGAGSLRIFGVGYVDTRSTVLKADNRPGGSGARRTRATSRSAPGERTSVHVFNTAEIRHIRPFIGWGVVQTGTWGNLDTARGRIRGRSRLAGASEHGQALDQLSAIRTAAAMGIPTTRATARFSSC